MLSTDETRVVKIFWPSDLLDTADSALVLGWQNSATDLFVIDLVSNIYVSQSDKVARCNSDMLRETGWSNH